MKKSVGFAEIAVGAGVAIFFAGFAALFIGELVLMLSEFNSEQARLIASYASQQFVFFPTAGVFMLICFYPLTYKQILNRVRQGPRGVLVVATFLALIFAAGIGLSYVLDGGGSKDKGRTVWEVAPDAPAQGEGCSVAAAFDAHRAYAEYVQPGRAKADVAPEKAVSEPTTDKEQQTFCAVLGGERSIAECRAAQASFRACVRDLGNAKPSKVSEYHRYALTGEAIFLLGMLFLGLRLAGQSSKLWGGGAGRAERLLLCGALLLALWPLLNTNYVASAAAIYGENAPSAYRRMSPLFNVAYVAWAISVINFLQKRFAHGGAESLWRIVTVGATALGALQFDSIIALFRQYLGPGADTPEMIAFVVLYMTLCYQIAGIMLGKGQDKGEDPDEQGENKRATAPT